MGNRFEEMYKQKLNFLVIKIVKRVLFLINGKINS